MIGMIIGLTVGALVLAMLLAPLETLGWWAGWYGEELEDETKPPVTQSTPYRTFGPTGQSFRRHYVVFLDGIAKVGDINYDDVQGLLGDLSRRMPTATVLGDVMPYSVTNRGLLAGRPLARFWRLAFRLKVAGRAPIINFMINIRNMFQVFVAADSRYGPIFGQGEAHAILLSLLRQGFNPEEEAPVTLIGYSGGAQVALTAAPYLRGSVRGPLNVISLAGVMANSNGLQYIEHMWHLQGTKDIVPNIAAVISPGRWKVFRDSYWNRMHKEGRYTFLQLPAITHSGDGSYLDADAMVGDKSARQHTGDVLVSILRDIEQQHRISPGD